MSSAEASATIHLGRSRVPWSRSRQVLSRIMRKFIRRLKRMVKCVQKGKPTEESRWVYRCWRYLFSRPVARQLSSAKVSLTSVFGMGTGGPSLQSTPTDGSILHPSAVVNYIFPLFSLPLMFFRQAADRAGLGSHNPGQRPASPADPPGLGGSGYTAAFPLSRGASGWCRGQC